MKGSYHKMKKDNKVLKIWDDLISSPYRKSYMAIFTIKGVMFEIYSRAESDILAELLL